jgi:FtsH-binding integral membrane protein
MKTTSDIDKKLHTIAEKSLLNNVFLWMALGLSMTGIIAYIISSTPSILALLVTNEEITVFGYFIMFFPIGFVLLMSFGFSRLSYFSLVILYMLYATIMGTSLSFVFLIYTNESIYITFFIAALMFGTMGVAGFFTKVDLTKMGSILLMTLVGIIIASLVNLFMKSDSLSYVISFISVILFCGLTAWDIQKFKNLEKETSYDLEIRSKVGILGALTLYLDFINLFLSLLRFTGNRERN